MKVTKKIFEDKVGRKPVDDDLERANCNYRGEIHTHCGWCVDHDKPIFVCGCRSITKPTKREE